jgi:hypothetical protein
MVRWGLRVSFVLDHVFMLVSEGAPEADELVRFGLTEGSRNVHPGMGTANRRFFFDNAMLELLYVQDPAEAQSEPIRPAGIWERACYRESGAAPFALNIRRSVADAPIPFETFDWAPPFLPAGVVLPAGRTVPNVEPFVFVARFGLRPHPFTEDRPEPIEHPAGLRRVSGVRISYHQPGPPSAPLQELTRLGIASFAEGEPLLELTFDGGSVGQSQDFRPTLPLVLHW